MSSPRRQVGVWLAAILLGAGLARAQTITDFNPKYGMVGEQISINGSSFVPFGTTIRFNGTVASNYVTAAFPASFLYAWVPAGATTGLISVQTTGGQVYNGQTFTVIGAGPYISGFSPTNGGAGTVVTIQGAHFTGATGVKFNGTNAAFDPITVGTQIKAYAPSGVTTGPITVIGPQGTNTSTTIFYAPPVITGFAPTAGRANTNIIITGKSFTGANSVTINGQSASFVVNANTQITVTVPAGATTGQIIVFANIFAAPSGSNFVVQPNITGFSPMIGRAGTNVIVTGENFLGTTNVKFGGVNAAFSGGSYGQLTATVPASATNGTITVTTTNGTSTSADLFYLPPVITSFLPTSSGPGSIVRINGTNFLGTSSVTFNGTNAASVWVTNNTTIGALVPFQVTSGPISVTTPAGTATSSGRFYAPPVITVFFPTHGLPGTNVTITGTNFLDASQVIFNGSNAVFGVVNNNTITATVPNNAQTGPITVVAPAGTNTTAQNFVLDYTADLAVTITDSPDPVTVGSNLTYSIVVLNNGPFPAFGVTLSATLPASTILKSSTTTAGNLNTNSNPVTANFSQLNVASPVTVTLVVTPQTAGTITNLVSVAGLYTDQTSTNNTAQAVTLVQPAAVLSIQLVNTNNVRVAWPAALTNYTLEFKPFLATTNFWSNVITIPQPSGNESVVTETNVGAMKFYRLRK